MNRRVAAALLAAGGVAAGVAGTLLALGDRGATRSAAPKPIPMAIHAQVLAAESKRDLIVMRADARVFSAAVKGELLSQQSKLYYGSRARFDYIVSMDAIQKNNFKYDEAQDVLTVQIPKIRIQTDVYGPRERIASLALLASEGGSGNELERVASEALEDDARREANRPELVHAAVNSAKYEIGKLYEDVLRAAGHTTRVVVDASNEPLG